MVQYIFSNSHDPWIEFFYMNKALELGAREPLRSYWLLRIWLKIEPDFIEPDLIWR
jgi:hypothetical protein